MNIGLIILILYTLSLLGLAYYASKQDKKNIKDFATASGSLGIFVLTLTFSATYHSAYAFLGASGFVYTHGIGWWVNGLWTVLPGIMFWVLGRRYWFLGKRYGYISIADYVSDAYRSNFVGIIVSIVCLVFTIPYVAMQAIGSGYIFQSISGGKLSYEVGTIIFFAIMIILVWLGGMKGVAITDAAQGVFMWIGLVIGSYWIVKLNFGSVTNGYKEVLKIAPELFTLPGPKGVITSADWISRWVTITIGMMMFPHITLRFFSGKSLKVLKWSSVFSSIYLTSIYIFTPAIGFIGRIIFPNAKNPDIIFPEMLLKFTPIIFASLIIAGALAASMSTGDSQLHAISALISTDIYKKYINKNASEYKMYRVAKICVLIFGLISIIFALKKPGLLGNILALSTGGAAVLAPTMIGGIYWKKATKHGAIWSIIIGELTMLFTTFVVNSPLGIMPSMWALIVSIVIFIPVSLATKPHKHTEEIINSINQFFTLGIKEASVNTSKKF